MSEANRDMPRSAPPVRACVECTYIQMTARGQGNRSAYTAYCTKFGTNAHEERTSMGTCGPTGTAWQAMGTDPGTQYTLDQPQAPVVAGTQEAEAATVSTPTVAP